MFGRWRLGFDRTRSWMRVFDHRFWLDGRLIEVRKKRGLSDQSHHGGGDLSRLSNILFIKWPLSRLVTGIDYAHHSRSGGQGNHQQASRVRPFQVFGDLWIRKIR